MRLLRLSLAGVRNLAPVHLDTDAEFIVFSGENGQGKTNVLEAVWWLATLRPLRGHKPKDLVGFDVDAAFVEGEVHAQGLTHALRVSQEGGKREVHRDGSRVNDLGEYFAEIRAIAFQPSDGEIVTGEPAKRRAWMDRAAFTASPAHLALVRDYGRVVQHKGALLKSRQVDHTVLDAFDDQLARLGGQLAQRRASMLAELWPHVQALHAELAGVGAQQLGWRYRTAAEGDSAASRAATLRSKLHASRSDELRRGQVLVGPQSDDLIFQLDDQPSRTFGSRGQVRSLVLALKLAELRAARARGVVPLFLLDDVSSELDRARTRRLVALLSEMEAQVLATTTDPSHIEGLPEGRVRHVSVSAGTLRVLAPDPQAG